MTEETVFYRPALIEFQVTTDDSNMPESFGNFETAEEMSKFIGGKLTVVNTALTVLRHMDSKEKKDLQEKYSELLENVVPIFGTKLYDAQFAPKAEKGKK